MILALLIGYFCGTNLVELDNKLDDGEFKIANWVMFSIYYLILCFAVLYCLGSVVATYGIIALALLSLVNARPEWIPNVLRQDVVLLLADIGTWFVVLAMRIEWWFSKRFKK